MSDECYGRILANDIKVDTTDQYMLYS